MAFALLVPNPDTGCKVVHEILDKPHGHPSLEWVDISSMRGAVVGWVKQLDGTLGPHVPDPDVARVEAIQRLRFACQQTIFGGFSSSALGAAYSYASTQTDQANTDRAALAALTGGDAWVAQISCVDAGGAKAFRPHTAKQVLKVVSDMHAAVEAARVKLDGLKAKVAAATTAADIAAIIWA